MFVNSMENTDFDQGIKRLEELSIFLICKNLNYKMVTTISLTHVQRFLWCLRVVGITYKCSMCLIENIKKRNLTVHRTPHI